MLNDIQGSFKPSRAELRMKVLLAAELQTQSHRMSCRMVDLSRGGACLELDAPIALGSQVTLHRGPMEAKAQLVWAKGRHCGIRFDQSIRATDLLVQMSESRSANRPPQPAPVTAAMSPSPSS